MTCTTDSQVFWNFNDNSLEVTGVRRKDESTGDFVYDTDGDAVVTATLNNPSGVPLSGQTWPLTLQHIPASNGDFIGTLDDLIVTTGLTYAVLDVEIEWEYAAGKVLVASFSCHVPIASRQSCPLIIEAAEQVVETPATTINILELANAPAKMVGDEGTVHERKISELIEADKYLKAGTAVTGGFPFGMHITRIKPGSTVESP